MGPEKTQVLQQGLSGQAHQTTQFHQDEGRTDQNQGGTRSAPSPAYHVQVNRQAQDE